MRQLFSRNRTAFTVIALIAFFLAHFAGEPLHRASHFFDQSAFDQPAFSQPELAQKTLDQLSSQFSTDKVSQDKKQSQEPTYRLASASNTELRGSEADAATDCLFLKVLKNALKSPLRIGIGLFVATNGFDIQRLITPPDAPFISRHLSSAHSARGPPLFV